MRTIEKLAETPDASMTYGPLTFTISGMERADKVGFCLLKA